MRTRLFISFILIVLVTVSSVVLISRFTAASQVRTFMFRGGITGTDKIVSSLETYYQTHLNWHGVEELFQSNEGAFGEPRRGPMMGPRMGGMMNYHFALADDNGNLIYKTQGAELTDGVLIMEMDGTIPLYYDGQVIGFFLPEGGMTFSPREENLLLTRINQAALKAGLIGGSLALLLSILLAYRLLSPIQKLSTAAEHITTGNLEHRVSIQGSDEIAALGKTFNQMAASLDRLEQSRRAMTADIAHELRNPLAVQRAHLDAIQDGLYPLTSENLEPIVDQNKILTRLVEDLRTLALADAGQLKLDKTPINFSEQVKRVIQQYQPNAIESKIDIKFTSAGSYPQINGDKERVEQILGNLFSNALRYTPENGQIKIELAHLSNWVQLTIHDNGPGIPSDALPNIFDRFYRSDQSRSRSKGGTGLGLAIARQLAQAHRGSLSADNHPDGGAIFTLKLPLTGDNEK